VLPRGFGDSCLVDSTRSRVIRLRHHSLSDGLRSVIPVFRTTAPRHQAMAICATLKIQIVNTPVIQWNLPALVSLPEPVPSETRNCLREIGSAESGSCESSAECTSSTCHHRSDGLKSEPVLADLHPLRSRHGGSTHWQIMHR